MPQNISIDQFLKMVDEELLAEVENFDKEASRLEKIPNKNDFGNRLVKDLYFKSRVVDSVRRIVMSRLRDKLQ